MISHLQTHSPTPTQYPPQQHVVESTKTPTTYSCYALSIPTTTCVGTHYHNPQPTTAPPRHRTLDRFDDIPKSHDLIRHPEDGITDFLLRAGSYLGEALDIQRKKKALRELSLVTSDFEATIDDLGKCMCMEMYESFGRAYDSIRSYSQIFTKFRVKVLCSLHHDLPSSPLPSPLPSLFPNPDTVSQKLPLL